jgi:glycosyltransferase involved in cell wall biosynthesis
MKSVCMLVQNVYDVDPRVKRKAEALVAAGYRVDVLALRSTNGNANYTMNGVNVYTLALGKKRGSLARYVLEYAAFFLWAVARVTVLMRRHAYIVIDINTLPDFLVFAAVPARWMGAKLILDMHEITPEFYMSKFHTPEASWLVRLLKWQEKISFNCADRVLTITEPIQDLLIARGLDLARTTVVMNAVDETLFTPVLDSKVPDRDPAKFIMMYHGTLTRVYGLELALEAFCLAHKNMPGAELWILGSGPEQGRLEELARGYGISSKVKLFGRVPSSEMPAWLAKCDAGILPMRRDVFLDFAFPNKLPEFIIMGKPVLIARLKTITYYFGARGLAFFEPNDPTDLARQMFRLYQDSELRERLSTRAKQEYMPLRWDIMKRRYLDVIEQISGVPRRAETSLTPESMAVGE